MHEMPLTTETVEGSQGESYTVQVFETFETCTCPGFQFRGTCKHTKKVRQEFLNKA